MNNFNLDEWLKTKKKGISGKIPREDFIAKIKELHELGQKLEKEKSELTNQNKKLNGELKTLQSDLTVREQIIKENETNLKNKDKTITEYEASVKQIKAELSEKETQLNQRPDITDKQHQELLNNQEKHTKEDLRPDNLPEDWGKQLSDRQNLEDKNKEMEEQLKEVYHTYPIILEEEKPENIKKYISELSGEIDELQQEKEKYKDYGEIKTELENTKKRLRESFEERSLMNKTIEELKNQLEATRRDKSPVLNKDNLLEKQPLKDNSELIEIKNFLTEKLSTIQSEITQLKQTYKTPRQNQTELPTDYEFLKRENKDLLQILKWVREKLPKDN